jgi:hypothetical protein
MSQIDYFRRQAADCRKALHYAETHPGFALKEVLSDGFERDITEQHKQGLRAAIIEYEKCIAYLEQHAVGQAERLPERQTRRFGGSLRLRCRSASPSRYDSDEAEPSVDRNG